MFENFRPLGNRVLVRKIEPEQKTESGLFIPDSAVDQSFQQGTVLAGGPGIIGTDGNTIPMQVKVGDTICFGKYVGTEAGVNYIIVREDEILGVIDQDCLD